TLPGEAEDGLDIGRAREGVELQVGIDLQRGHEAGQAARVVPHTPDLHDSEVCVRPGEGGPGQTTATGHLHRLLQLRYRLVDLEVRVVVHGLAVEIENLLEWSLRRHGRAYE